MQNKFTIQKLLNCILFFLALASFAQAQTSTYQVQLINYNGIVNPGEITQLMKDSKGFLWLVSPSKVQRYDGKKFVSFPFEDHCVNIAQDNEGTLWLATWQNIYRYKNDYSGFEKLEPYSDSKERYLALLAGPGKKIFLLTLHTIQQWNSTTKKMEQLPVDSIDGNYSFPSLKSSGSYLFFIKNETTLARYNVITKTTDDLPVTNGSFIFPVNENSVWVRQSIGSSALVSFKSKTIVSVTQSQIPEKVNDNAFFVTGSSNNFSFISIRDKGYYSYDAVTKKFSTIKLLYNGLPLAGSPPLNSFYEEGDGTIWFANEEGLVHLNPGNNQIGLLRSNVATGENWNNAVRNFAEDENGNIWFGTANGFSMLNRQKGTIKTWLPESESKNYLNYTSVRSIGYNKGKIIIGQSQKGFWIFNPADNSFTRPKFENDSAEYEFEESFNSNMLQLRNGDFLIFSVDVWLMDKTSFKVKKINLAGVNPNPRTGLEDHQGRIWLLGGGGIFVLDKELNLLYSFPDKDKGKWYNAIVQINENTFWVASKNIFEMKIAENGVLKMTALFPELPTLHFSNLYKDSLQRIWMFSDAGIYRYIPTGKLLEKFNREDNAQPYDINISNSFRSSNGILYAGSANGINYFVPEKIPLVQDSLMVHLLNVSVNQDDSSFLINQAFPKLKYTQNSLVFDFIAPYVFSGNKVQYRCMLQGEDKDWIYLGNNNSIRYTSVKPGEYSFLVSASLNGKDWFQIKKPLSLIISPPYWQTWWFRLLTALLLIASGFYFVQRKIQAIKNKAAIKQQITQLEVTALRAQMNPHFIFNALNSIQHFTLRNDIDNANLYISKFSTLLRKILHSSQQNYISLEDEIEQLKLYLDIEKLRMGNNFTYTITVDDSIETDAVKIPGMLVQPFVENALKHGLALKEGSKRLEITFQFATENELKIMVLDNGIGLIKSQQLKKQHEKLLPHQSKGIQMARDRLSLLNLSVFPVETIEIKDIIDAAGNTSGTQVVIMLPAHQV